MERVKRSKGQVVLIIGIAITLSLILIKMGSGIGKTLQKQEPKLSTTAEKLLPNLEKEYREVYQIAIKQEASDQVIKDKIQNFTSFLRRELKPTKLFLFHSFSTYNNETLNVTLQNFLGREMRGVELRQNLTSPNASIQELGRGEVNTTVFNAPGKNEAYRINLTYQDSATGKKYSIIYLGKTGEKGIYTSSVLWIGIKGKEMKLTGQVKLGSEPQT